VYIDVPVENTAKYARSDLHWERVGRRRGRRWRRTSRDNMAANTGRRGVRFKWSCWVVSTSSSVADDVRSPSLSADAAVYVERRTGSVALTCWRRRIRCRAPAAPALQHTNRTRNNKQNAVAKQTNRGKTNRISTELILQRDTISRSTEKLTERWVT